jgi:sulfur-carrier protein
MADVRLPGTLSPLFPGLPRRLEIEAATVLGAIDELDAEWPGLRDRLVAEGPSLRPHIHTYVDGERSGLDAPLEPRSRLDVIAAISGGAPLGFIPAG